MEAFTCDGLITRLADHYGARLSEQRRRSYFEHLIGMKEATLKQAVWEIEERWVPERGEDKMPSIRHIRQVCHDIEGRAARTEANAARGESPPTEEEWVNSRAAELAFGILMSGMKRDAPDKRPMADILAKCRSQIQSRVDKARAEGRMNIKFAPTPSATVAPEDYDPFAEE
jgi:hypothetical protein